MLRANPKQGREIERARQDWTGPKAGLPTPFVLVGYESPYVFPVDGQDPLVIDADGVVFLSGEVFTWCRAGCCETNPRRWTSVKQAADAHSAYVIGPDAPSTRQTRSALTSRTERVLSMGYRRRPRR